MNYPDSGTVTTTGKSTRFSSAARALVLGLALVLPGAAALAGEPIPGVDVNIRCCFRTTPGGITVSAPTGADGVYQFKGLAPGNYDLFVGGQRVQTINVGANRSISGVLSSDGGKASITFNGQVGVVPDLPSAPVSTTRSNKKAGIAKGKVPPPDDVPPSAPVNTSRSHLQHGEHGPSKVAENESPRPTNRGIIVGAGAGGGPHASPKGDDEKPGISDQGTVGGLISYAAAPPPGDYDMDGKPAARVAVTVYPVNDAPSKAADPIPTAFGQPVTFTATVAPVNPANNPPAIAEANSALGAVSTTRGTARRPDGGDGKLPGLAGDPIPGVDVRGTDAEKPGMATPGDPVPGTSVGLDHDPGGPISTTKTGPDGAYQFTGLPAGKYKLTFPGLPAKSITIGTDGKTGGKVLRDGNSVIVTGDFEGSPARSQASANPVPSFLGGVFPGIGIGNVMGGILPGMGPSAVGPGAGPMSPAAGPIGPGGPMGASPMGPGAGAIRR